MTIDNSKIIYKKYSIREIDGCRTAACRCMTAIGFPNELIVRSDIYHTVCPVCGETVGLYCLSKEDYDNGIRWQV